MESTSHSIEFKNTLLHYDAIGSGERPLLLFHGFGQNKAVFNELADVLSEKYTVYTFDLFFHGKSQWNKDEQPLEKEFWKELMTAFFNKHQIKSHSVLGFSLGGKFAACSSKSLSLTVLSLG